MEAIFHFVFELLKIAILSSAYAIILVSILSFLNKRMSNEFLTKILNSKFKTWVVFGFLISVSLFTYMFSYWGNHGLGDYARIPVGYGKEVSEINGTQAYIESNEYNYGSLPVKNFSKQKHFIIGETDSSPVDIPPPYYFWNLKNNKLILFSSEIEFRHYLLEFGLSNYELKSFRENYKKYWLGWRFWLLP